VAKTVANRIPAETSLTSADPGPNSAPSAERIQAEADSSPEWEIQARRLGRVPTMIGDWYGDADYLVARLRRALGAARDHAAEFRTGEFEDGRLADSVELELLRADIDKLISELRPYGRAGEEMLAILRRLAPTLTWVQSAGGLLGMALNAEAERDIDGTAAHLRLREDVERGERFTGVRYWVGMHEGWRVTISCPMMHRRVMHDAVTHASERDA
jgi:hypothetical protein